MVGLVTKLLRGWTGDNRAQVRGTAFLEGRMLSGPALSDHIGGLAGRDAVLSFLREANGFFSVVCWDGRRGWMAADRVRGLPLYYGERDGTVFVSDDAFEVLAFVGDPSMDQEAQEELLALGYVTGGDTLFGDVKQVQAGEVVFLELDGRGHIARAPEDYYIYRHEPPFGGDEGELAEAMDRALESSFRRLTEYAAGRPVVVPLSGGYDSRLVVTLLKRMGYPDIRTFTYGIPEKGEISVSRFVAESLGVPWHFVPYTPGEWYRWYRSAELEGYMRYACGGTVMPTIRDLPALLELRDRGAVPEGCVFVPGHTPVRFREHDSLLAAFEAGYTGEKAFFSMLRSIHYGPGSAESAVCVNRNGLFVRRHAPQTVEDWLSLADTWAWRERQSKQLISWCQAYEHLGHSWWLPFWDREYADLYAALPRVLHRDRAFYIEYVRRRFAETAEFPLERSPFNAFPAKVPPMRRLLMKEAAEKILPTRLLNLLRCALFIRRRRRDMLFGFPGLFTERELWRMALSSGTMFRPYAEDFLRLLERWVRTDGPLSEGCGEGEMPC